MSMVGIVSSLCQSEEYAVVDPANGDPSVFVDADEFGRDWNELVPGMLVKFSVLQGLRGPKAYNVTVVGSLAPSQALDVQHEMHENWA